MVAQRLALMETRLAADRVYPTKSPEDLHDADGGGD
jgi:hypothetical protein